MEAEGVEEALSWHGWNSFKAPGIYKNSYPLI